ncbi:Na+/H+ antiporter [Saccharopolyspora sp. TS4A08]|uniref:Na+/H+ antiporter n=1 Tax=Saccharopolyspora ipomoeae TaxID=3042027 RepID=A0ABT6PY93_9PSEU|nr:Na+/H+ antiporter [Saccharopolyspora sp. TS4A08]MDI2032351.1 Na+/H+ antiporter [Saccharopolyspora sp. TS4A08]
MVQLILVLIGALLVTALARSREIASPLLLVAVGMAVSLVPGLDPLRIEPELLLTAVLPPLLYAAALDSSFTNFRARIRPIVHHGVLQVIVTSFVLGWIAFTLIPDLPLASAIVLGAVIAPPDAVTAAAIGRQLKLPRGVMTVLGGESLINDAAALTIYRMAITAVVGTTPSLAHGLGVFALAVVVGVVLGLGFGMLAQLARQHVPDVQVATLLGVLVPFIAYLTAEELQGSGVLAVVTAGLYVGHNLPRARAAGRLQEHTVWGAINLLLESLVFAYIGLQLKSVVGDVVGSGRPVSGILLATLLILASAIAFRVLWMFASNYLPGVSHLIMSGRRGGRWRRTAVLSWAGMRGVVTLAAAGAIPFTTEAGAPLPGREVIQFVAAVVTVATILIQGTTLPPLIRRLGVTDPEEARSDDQAEAEARRIATNAALAYLDGLTPGEARCERSALNRMVSRMRDVVEHQGLAAAEQVGRTPAERADTATRTFAELRRGTIEVQRSAIADERDAGHLDDEVLRRVFRELDLQEAAVEGSWRNR